MRKSVKIFWLVILLAACFRLGQSLWSQNPDMYGCVGARTGKGLVDNEPESRQSFQVLDILVTDISENENCPVGFVLRVKTSLYPKFKYKDSVEFSGKISRPRNFGGDTGREFDYIGYLAKDDIYLEIKSAKLKLTEGEEVFQKSSSPRSGVTGTLFAIKKKFVDNLNRVLGEPHSALAAGLVVGEKSSLGTELVDEFRIVGLIHIVVLSGFNITIVGDALRKVLGFLPRVWGIMIGMLGIVLFGVMVGGGATVVRSCSMASIALAGDLIRREYNVTRALIFAGLFMLILNPDILLHDPSFQLSFLATAGLLLFATPIEKRLQFVSERFGLRGILASTFATQIFVSPFILYTMGQISIIGVFANILVLPFVPVTMLFVFLIGASGFISYHLSVILGWFTHLLLSYELSIVHFFSGIPYAALEIPPFSGWITAGFYVLIMTLYYFKSLKAFSETLQLRLAKKSSR